MKRILVFPCGSEIGLEIHRSLRFSSHIELIGASSVEDHGRFVYKQYISGMVFADHPDFIASVRSIVETHGIDAVYPTMDSVIHLLKKHEVEIGCKVIASPERTTTTCLSKKNTYEALRDVVKTPRIYSSAEEVERFPVFLKPDIGYGSRGVDKANDMTKLTEFIQKTPDRLILEYLPGEEYTIDCLSDKDGKLCFAGARQRRRVVNGISVHTSTESASDLFSDMARKINHTLDFTGAWFFQVKMNRNGEPVLLEVASRFAGSSAVYRVQGVNFALLSVHTAFGQPIEILPNHYAVELDRALSVCCRAAVDFSTVYVDCEKTLFMGGKINSPLMRFLFDAFNAEKRLVLITRQGTGPDEPAASADVSGVFHEIIHLQKWDRKSDVIVRDGAILIDDTFEERRRVMQECSIPVFSSDMVVDLLI